MKLNDPAIENAVLALAREQYTDTAPEKITPKSKLFELGDSIDRVGL